MDYAALLVICDSTFLIQNQDIWTAGRYTEDRNYLEALKEFPPYCRLHTGRAAKACPSLKKCLPDTNNLRKGRKESEDSCEQLHLSTHCSLGLLTPPDASGASLERGQAEADNVGSSKTQRIKNEFFSVVL